MKALLILFVIAVILNVIKRLTKKKYVAYVHHGTTKVIVRSDLKGKHRDYCLCFKCYRFHPGERKNCPVAQAIYSNCLTHNIVTPVWECPSFIRN